MKVSSKTCSLIHGCDIISRKLTHCLCPMGLLVKFESNEPRKPKPLPIGVVLMISMTIVLLFLHDIIMGRDSPDLIQRRAEFKLLAESAFLMMMIEFYEVFRFIFYLITLLTPIAQHGPITNVLAQRNKMVSETEQASIAKEVFYVFFFRTLLSNSPILFLILSLNLGWDDWQLYYFFVSMSTTFLLNLTVTAPFIYISYLGSCLGKHVENFSELYIDTLFDQFENIQDASGETSSNLSLHGSSHNETQAQANGGIVSSLTSLVSGKTDLMKRIRCVISYLNSNEYPNDHEVEMNKTTGNLKITEATRISNTYLIRNRLRKTQIMLSELRDTVNDINKLSSMLILLQVLYDLLLMVLITTASIQTRTYRSLSILVAPTVTQTIASIVSVVYICTCLDETTSQLKLMINKLFDFIIINLRVRINDTSRSDISSVTPSNIHNMFEKDDEVQSETWCQFQYTRKLAGTINFTMGGILIVSRRLILPILAHILSAVFISIEIMSIIDTLGHHNDRTPIHHSHNGSHHMGLL